MRFLVALAAFFVVVSSLQAGGRPPAKNTAATDFANAKWEQIGESDGIVVWKWDVPDSAVLAFRGIGTIEQPIAKVANVLFDAKRQKEWVPELGDFRDVRELSHTEKLQYFAIKTPFVVKNRDFLIHGGVELDKTKREITIWFHSTEDSAVPMTDMVRGDIRAGQYKLVSNEEGTKTDLEIMVHLDPKGSVPKWLFNMIQKNYPHDTIMGIRKQAAKNDVPLHPEVVAALRR